MAKNDFLQFNAYRIKDLIKQKLVQDSKFTYQIYDGSNLDILIDIVSYMFQGFLYSLNSSASESMFADTQFYENINRLCKFLGYNPKGQSTQSATFSISQLENSNPFDYQNLSIPRYAYLKTQKSDKNGNIVCYSFASDGSNSTGIKVGDSFTLYNGKWKLYPNVLTVSGENWETFILDLKSDSMANKYVPHGFIDVYAYDSENNLWYYFKPTTNQLFKPINEININDDRLESGASKYDNFDGANVLYGNTLHNITNKEQAIRSNNSDGNGVRNQVFNLTLNEDKNYVITFGDGTTGAKPPKGSLLYIVYLQSNGPSGNLDLNEIENESLNFNSLGMNDNFWEIFSGNNQNNNNQNLQQYRHLESIKMSNITTTTEYRDEETVDEIRENAPAWFRSGGRLVTKDDYESFFKYTPTIKNSVKDVKCQNNWEYVSTFYKWLYDLGISGHNDPRYYLNQNNLVKAEYQVADPADCNNVYIWYKPVSESIETTVPGFNEAAYAIKDMTHEPLACRGIPVNFAISAAPKDIVEKIIKKNGYHVTAGSVGSIDGGGDPSYIEIQMADDVMYSNSTIIMMIASKIQNFFEKEMGLGYKMNFSDLMTSIYSINGIKNIRTVYCPTENEPANAIVYNGLSFASWSGTDLIDVCEDLEVSTNPRTMEIFQYPLYNCGDKNPNRYAGLKTGIRIIKRALTSLNSIQY